MQAAGSSRISCSIPPLRWCPSCFCCFRPRTDRICTRLHSEAISRLAFAMQMTSQGLPINATLDSEKLKKFKTQLCQRMLKTGQCRFAVLCDFAHNEGEIRRNVNQHWYYGVRCNRPDCRDRDCNYAHNDTEVEYHPHNWKTRLCPLHTKPGGCPRKTYCPHAHGKQELRQIKPIPGQYPPPPQPPAPPSSSGSGSVPTAADFPAIRAGASTAASSTGSSSSAAAAPSHYAAAVAAGVSASSAHPVASASSAAADAAPQHQPPSSSAPPSASTSTSAPAPAPNSALDQQSGTGSVPGLSAPASPHGFGGVLPNDSELRDATDQLKIRLLDIVDQLTGMHLERASYDARQQHAALENALQHKHAEAAGLAQQLQSARAIAGGLDDHLAASRAILSQLRAALAEKKAAGTGTGAGAGKEGTGALALLDRLEEKQRQLAVAAASMKNALSTAMLPIGGYHPFPAHPHAAAMPSFFPPQQHSWGIHHQEEGAELE